MKKGIRTAMALFCDLLAAVLFLTAQLSVVSGTVMSGTILSYHAPLRNGMHSLSILCILAGAALWKTDRAWKTAVKLTLSAAMLLFVLLFGFPCNTMA